MKYTLYELLNQYHIIIPQIQRDYAQGRSEQSELRTDFISTIKEALQPGSFSLNLDFVYGYTEPINSNESAFIPLDGQQRLTTLWLLHWYVSPREIKQENSVDMAYIASTTELWLRKFTYRTRNSSKRFCEELVKNGLPVSGEPLSGLIEDAPWFMAAWKNDPTVVAMLNMLDTIQNEKFEQQVSWENLTEHRKITFDYIDIRSDKFKLTDELYIKMNSRGKPLTVFENFKAQFSGILLSEKNNYAGETLIYKDTAVTYQQYFAFQIDGAWLDIFWDFSRQKKGEGEMKVDEYLMNFFVYIAQMCYFKDHPDRNAEDFRNDFTVFHKKENVLFLFHSLDWLCKISTGNKQVDVKRIDAFFSSVFQAGRIDDTYNNQVRLFEGETGGINLFEKCLTEGRIFDNRNRIMLYCFLTFVIRYDCTEPGDALKNFIRVVRNLLQATRQRNETVFNTNVRINYFGKYYRLIQQLMKQENVYTCLLSEIDNKETEISNAALENEKQKAEIVLQGDEEINRALFLLEEFKHFGGLIHALKPRENKSKLKDYSRAVREIWSNHNEDPLIISAMIANGFRGFYTKDCRLGEMWFFGKKDKWNTILTSGDAEIAESLLRLLDNYIAQPGESPKEKLSAIIRNYLAGLSEKTWRYYFLKYPQMLSRSNYFAWLNDFEIRILGSYGSNPLLAYHINPYVLVAGTLLGNTICEERYWYSQYRYTSGLVLKNGIILYCERKGWSIELPVNYSLNEELKRKYNIGDDYLLMEGDIKDRIEIAVDFCKEIF